MFEVIKEENNTIILKKGEMANIICTDGRPCDGVHIHGDKNIIISLRLTKNYYKNGDIRCYIDVDINGVYIMSLCGYELESIIN